MKNAMARRTPSARIWCDRVREVRAPVAVAPVDGQVDALPWQLVAQGGDEHAVLLVDRTHATEVEVVLTHLAQPLLGDAASARHVLQERHHVVGSLRPTERDDEQRIDLFP